MKLYLFDQKHERVLDEMEITNVQQVMAMIRFLDKNNLTNLYNRLVIANGYEIDYDENNERMVIFEYGGN